MHVVRRDVVERVARRRIAQIGDGVPAMERIDRGRQTSGLAGKARQHEAAAAAAHHLGEVGARIAGRPVALEDHVDAVRLEALDPAREW